MITGALDLCGLERRRRGQRFAHLGAPGCAGQHLARPLRSSRTLAGHCYLFGVFLSYDSKLEWTSELISLPGL